MNFFRFLIFLLLAVFYGLLGNLSGTFSSTADLSAQESMVEVPGGPFLMGSSPEDVEWSVQKFFAESEEWYRDETPGQASHLKKFLIDTFEVTVAQYNEFIQATRREPPKYFDNPNFNQPRQPVVGVTWQEALDYCLWRGKRLPTEAEWEKSARGVDGRRYPWGNDPDPSKANSRGKGDPFRYPSPVGKFPQGKSPFGVMDMSGNVFEWTQDWYGPFPGNDQKSDLFGQQFKVIKGGSWKANMDLARSAVRGKSLPDQRWNWVGFRCVKELGKGN